MSPCHFSFFNLDAKYRKLCVYTETYEPERKGEDEVASLWQRPHRIEIAVSVEKFQKQRAVNVAVPGSYILPNWYDPQGRLRTFACRTKRVSPFRMIVDVPVIGKVGDRLKSFFQDFGKFEGVISDTTDNGFLLELEMPPSMRESFATKLVWLEKKLKEPGLSDLRKDARIIPANPHSTLTLADGTIHQCFVIDMSVSGIAVSSPVQPHIGTPLAVGACVGRVVRLLPDGFAIKFLDRQNRHELDRLISRSATRFLRSARFETAA